MLDSPLGAVVAASRLEPMVEFLSALDLVVTATGILPSELYGGPGRWADLASADRGRVRVVEVPGAAITRGAFDAGPAALDFYSRDLQASLAVLTGRHGPKVQIDLGPLVMHQVRVLGPDGVPVVLIDANHRRPSRLDSDEAALHSEAHSLVWVVPSIDDALPFWRDVAGLSVAFDLPISSPAVAELMDLPRADVPIRMSMLSDPELRPMRLELFEFPTDRGAAFDPAPRPGAVWPAFEVSDLSAALALPWLETGAVVAVGERRVSRCVAPGGVALELWA